MSLFSHSGSQHLPTFAREVFDVTRRRGHGHRNAGPGSLRQVQRWKSPLFWPIIAAGLVVGKVGTATVSRAELLADFASRNAHSSS